METLAIILLPFFVNVLETDLVADSVSNEYDSSSSSFPQEVNTIVANSDNNTMKLNVFVFTMMILCFYVKLIL